MRKRWITMVLAAAMSAAAQAQDVAELFLKMPDTQLVLLNEASRKTLVDMHRAGEKATVNNEMGGMAEIWKMTDDYLWLETSMGNFIQIRRLPLVNHTYVICLITSVGIVRQGQDSRVEFFTTDWTPLPTATRASARAPPRSPILTPPARPPAPAARTGWPSSS